MFSQDKRGEQRRLLGIGDDGIYADAWGRQKVISDYSLFHGLFTFDVPDKMWIEYYNSVEQSKTNAVSLNGALKLSSASGSSYLMSRRHPRYQPNRGVLYSSSLFFDNATKSNGKLYAVIRTYRDGQTYEDRQECKFDNYSTIYDPAKGNIYDIQMQWRGVGGIKFYINQQEVYHFNYLGTLDELSISNPALPLGFEATNDGELRAGAVTPQFGAFFEWVFNTPQECSIRCGCVDLSSENGTDETQYFISAVGNAVTVSNAPILAIRIPEMFKSLMNTRDIQLHTIKASVDKKSDIEIYTTRDTTAFTINTGSWTTLNGGNIEVFKPTAAADSSLDIAKAQLVDVLPAEPNTNNVAVNPSPELIDYFLVHGDYLIIKAVGAQVTARCIVQAGEEL